MGPADYVIKPFSPTELAARIRTALRRRAAPEVAEPSEAHVMGGVTADYAWCRVELAGHPVKLTPIEYRLLSKLSMNGGRVLTREHKILEVSEMAKTLDLAGNFRSDAETLRKARDSQNVGLSPVIVDVGEG